MRIRKAVIPAAGLGTRLLPVTKAIPKELLPIIDIPALHIIVEEILASGMEQVILVTGRGKSAIEDYFDLSPELEMYLKEKGKTDLWHTVREIAAMVDVVSIRQKEPLGLGHAVLCARPLVGDEPFAVLLPDDLIDADPPCTRQLINTFEETGHGVVALLRVIPEESHLYGIIAGQQVKDRLYRLTTLIEKPGPAEAPSGLAVIGRYVLPPAIFTQLEATPPGRGGEIQITDALRSLCNREPLYGYEFIGRRYDIGDKVGYVQAIITYALKRPDMADRVKTLLREILETT